MKSNKWSLSRSARFSIRKRSGVSLLLFPAAYTSFQNPVTSVLLEGSARFAYRFVVLFFYSWNSLFFTFPAFSDLPHFGSSFDVPSTYTSDNKVEKPTWHVVHVHTRNHLVCTNKRTDVRKKHMITACKEWMLILQMQRRSYNIISCLNLYSSYIKKMINPDGRR